MCGLTLGARPEGRSTSFRVCAPESRRVDIVLFEAERAGTTIPIQVREVRALHRHEAGYWSGRIEGLSAGALYKFRLDGDEGRTFPDPASRRQPFGVHGPSEVVDAASFRWSDDGWVSPALEDLVIYELHVGTFTPEGTFRGAVERLGALADLGVPAIELMPVADFPAFADPAARERIPDPQAGDTFDRSRLEWSERALPLHAGTRRLYERLLALRRASRPLRDGRGAYAVHVLDEATLALDYRDGALLVVVRLRGAGAVQIEAPADAGVALSSEDAAFAPDAQPIALERRHHLAILFDRPGAVILRAGW